MNCDCELSAEFTGYKVYAEISGVADDIDDSHAAVPDIGFEEERLGIEDVLLVDTLRSLNDTANDLRHIDADLRVDGEGVGVFKSSGLTVGLGESFNIFKGFVFVIVPNLMLLGAAYAHVRNEVPLARTFSGKGVIVGRVDGEKKSFIVQGDKMAEIADMFAACGRDGKTVAFMDDDGIAAGDDENIIPLLEFVKDPAKIQILLKRSSEIVDLPHEDRSFLRCGSRQW